MSKKPESSPERHGKPTDSHDLEAEQARVAEEQAKAKEAEASIRARMVDIGRGNQQAGRQGE